MQFFAINLKDYPIKINITIIWAKLQLFINLKDNTMFFLAKNVKNEFSFVFLTFTN